MKSFVIIESSKIHHKSPKYNIFRCFRWHRLECATRLFKKKRNCIKYRVDLVPYIRIFAIFDERSAYLQTIGQDITFVRHRQGRQTAIHPSRKKWDSHQNILLSCGTHEITIHRNTRLIKKFIKIYVIKTLIYICDWFTTNNKHQIKPTKQIIILLRMWSIYAFSNKKRDHQTCPFLTYLLPAHVIESFDIEPLHSILLYGHTSR